MEITPQKLRLTQEIHARLVDIALNDPDREKRTAAADAEREFWDAYVVPIFGDRETRPDANGHGAYQYPAEHMVLGCAPCRQPGSADERDAVPAPAWPHPARNRLSNPAPMNTGLRPYAERLRRLALIVRHPAVAAHLLRLAADMEQVAGKNDRRQAAATDREAG